MNAWHKFVRNRPLFFLSMALVLSVGISGYFGMRSMRLERLLTNNYRRVFSNLSAGMEDLEANLTKGMVITAPNEMVYLASEIFRLSENAISDLGQLPSGNAELDRTSEFLAQVGDYCYRTALSHLSGTPVTDEESAHLKEFSKYAASFSESLSQMTAKAYDGSLDLSEAEHTLTKRETALTANLNEVEQQFQDYPSLTYDGPFSEHIKQETPKFLEGKPEITSTDAKKKAVRILGKRGEGLTESGECVGTIPCFRFERTDQTGRRIAIAISKTGGYPVWFLDNRTPTESLLSVEAAKKKADAFLSANKYPSMQSSYYEIKNNIATINYAYVQNGITVYSDLIKIRIAMDNGDILGMESEGYLMSHTERNFPLNLISSEQAKENLHQNVAVSQTKFALIPLESKREVLCHELKVSQNEHTFLVYVNAENGEIEKILMLLMDENGVLTI